MGEGMPLPGAGPHFRRCGRSSFQWQGGTQDKGTTRNGAYDAPAREQAMAAGNNGQLAGNNGQLVAILHSTPCKRLYQRVTKHATQIETITTPTLLPNGSKHQQKALEALRVPGLRVGQTITKQQAIQQMGESSQSGCLLGPVAHTQQECGTKVQAGPSKMMG